MAIFEIWLERFKSGWGGEFYSPFWGKKLYFSWVMKSMEKSYISVYHLVMFAGVLPGIYLAEYFLFVHWVGHHGWILSFEGFTVVPIIYFLAVWMGVAVGEDFLYFLLNWHFPDALRLFFKGELSWHTKWVNITPTKKVPKFYLTTPLYIAGLFALQSAVVWMSE